MAEFMRRASFNVKNPLPLIRLFDFSRVFASATFEKQNDYLTE